MFLGLDRQEVNKVAVKDNEGNALTYGQLAEEVEVFSHIVNSRSIVFMLCKNTVGSLAGYLGFIEGDAVPLVLSSKIEKGLLQSLVPRMPLSGRGPGNTTSVSLTSMHGRFFPSARTPTSSLT